MVSWRPGANDWKCKPSTQHPEPVILVHGFMANAANNWQTFSPLLHNQGYCVFALHYGAIGPIGGLSRSPQNLLSTIPENIKEFGAFVDVGVHQDGLVHVSELAHRFVKDPAEVAKVGDRVIGDSVPHTARLWRYLSLDRLIDLLATKRLFLTPLRARGPILAPSEIKLAS